MRALGAETGWGGNVPVGDWLFAEPERFEFTQIMRLLGTLQQGPVRLRSRGGFAFPPSEVAGLEQRPGESRLEVTVSLLALDGAFGPLPSVYAEERLDRERRAERSFGDFLDIFHHRLLELLYRIARAHRPALGESGASPSENTLLAIAGLGLKELRGRMAAPDGACPRYASLLGRDARSAHGLEQMLGDYTGHECRIVPYRGAWRKLERGQRTQLGIGGRSRRLGDGAVLGGRAWDDGAGVEVRFGSARRPLDGGGWRTLLPEGRRHGAVRDLIRLYLRGEYRFRFRLTVGAAAIPQSWLGGARLGHTSFLLTGRAAGPAEVSCAGSAND